jgi:hypothetical protein
VLTRIAAVLALALPLTAPQLAHAASPLVPSAAAYKSFGLSSTGTSVKTARNALGAGLSASVLALFKHATVDTSAGKGRGLGLVSDAFVLRSDSVAEKLLTSWRSHHHAHKAAIDAGGAVYEQTSHKRAIVEVLWRSGQRLGLVILDVTRQLSKARDEALADATLGDSFLRSILPQTAFGQVLAQTSSDGSWSKQTSLDAFALVFGPLPGVHPPTGAKSITDLGTDAAQWVLHYSSQLTHAQLAAVDRALGLPAPGKRIDAHTADLGDPEFHENAAIETIAQDWAAEEGAKLGIPLTLKIYAGTTSHDYAAYAVTQVLNASDGAGSGDAAICKIAVPPPGQAKETSDPEFFRLAIAHEVFHCFQGQIRGGRVWEPIPAWILEGGADWAALSVDPVDFSTGGGNLKTYIQNPTTPLFTRSYDAVGFWGHLNDEYGNLWRRWTSILLASSSAVAFDNSGANVGTVLDSWGSSPFRMADGGSPWRMISPIYPPPSEVATPTLPILSGAIPANVFAGPYSTQQYKISTVPTSPMLLVSVDGPARLSPYLNDTNLHDAWFCTTAQQYCVCPPHTSGVVPAHKSLTRGAYLGIAAAENATHGTLTSYPISAFCHPKPSNTGGSVPGGSGGGTGGSGGDPHLFAFHGGLFGGLFDFQAAGEFTLLKSTDRNDDFQIQERQQPFPHSETVAVNTAIAMRDGQTTVEVDLLGKSSLVVYVNKQRIHPEHVSLAGGGRLSANSSLAMITWSDGTTATIYNGGASPNFMRTVAPALDIAIKLSHDREGHVEGLLGNWGGSTEFVGRTGQKFPESELIGAAAVIVPTPQDFKALYDEFGASWRITQSESLFRYPPGKNTNSYTIKGFPKEHVTAATLPGAQKVAGQTACEGAGITNQALLDACTVDVGATGDPGFAGGDQKLQKTTKLPPTPAPTLHPIDLGAGSAQPELAYDPQSRDTYVVWLDDGGDAVEVCTVTTASQRCNGGAGPYRLDDALASSSGAAPGYYSPQVVVQPGGTVVVLAEVDGAAAAAGFGGIGDVAWSSAAGGAGFASAGGAIADGGRLLDNTAHAGDAPSGGAIALDQTHIGVYGSSNPFGSGFTDFTLSGPAPAPTPTVDSSTNFDATIGFTGNQLASVPDPAAPGEYIVVAVGAAGETPRGCPAGGGEATGYGVAVGTPAALEQQAAWSARYFLPISCSAFAPVLAGGGPSGGTIGLLEDEGPGLNGAGGDGVYYRRFDPSTDTFGAPALVSNETSHTLTGADQLSVSQDSSGGVYASWVDERGVELSYSPTAGASWPDPLPSGITSDAGDVIVAGVGTGSAQIAYNAGSSAGTQEYLVPVSYSPR